MTSIRPCEELCAPIGWRRLIPPLGRRLNAHVPAHILEAVIRDPQLPSGVGKGFFPPRHAIPPRWFGVRGTSTGLFGKINESDHGLGSASWPDALPSAPE
jgi:hypothetical protein